jgi:Uma2 family endonuclease
MVAAQTLLDAERPLTYDDLAGMPDDGQRYEIIGGELIVNPAPLVGHQRVFGQLFEFLRVFARETGAGEAIPAPFDVLLGRNDAVQPDLVFLLASHPRVRDNENSIDYPPDVAIEILSPSSRRIDLVKKMALYVRAGVPEYWVADPQERTLTINVLERDHYVPVAPESDGVLASRVVPGLRIDPAYVFATLE